MNIFNIRDIENLTGIKAHTLRVWEKRYGNIMPPTSVGKHRQYDNNDLRHILKISSLYHNGFKISKIANMSAEEIETATLEMDEKTSFEVFITRLIEFSIELNENGFKKLFSELREMMGDENLYHHIVFPFLARIGNLWLNGKVVPVQEHFCSTLIRNELLLSIDQITQKSRFNTSTIKVLLFTPESEFHEIPLLFFNLLLKKLRFHTIYLGTNCTFSVVKDVLAKTKTNTLLVYLITNLGDKNSQLLVDEYTSHFPKEKIIFAGPGFKDAETKSVNGFMARNLESVIDFFKSSEK
jgi:DNA-binding transcriptional MerR regulator